MNGPEITAWVVFVCVMGSAVGLPLGVCKNAQRAIDAGGEGEGSRVRALYPPPWVEKKERRSRSACATGVRGLLWRAIPAFRSLGTRGVGVPRRDAAVFRRRAVRPPQ